MATFNGKRVPTVSQYINDLNAIKPDHDHLAPQEDNFDFDGLAAFTNAEFIDFDVGGPAISQPSAADFDPAHDHDQSRNGSDGAGFMHDNYSFHGMSPFLPTDPTLNVPHPIQTHYSAPPPSATTVTSPTSYSPVPQARSKPANASSPTTHNFDDATRAAAEEDKRRRNTAASARFRVKKKQREQALERTVKELNDKTSHLEQRVGQLQVENEWLKGLVIEKKGKDYLAEEWKAFKRRAGSETSSSSDDGARSTETKKKGIGTRREH
ncbi:MAG: hypothetical protein LQ342_005333 [Letrouitia transgressa]|nr:MAG: hypothetical protein LQ342_005333 [Letrouitia transgressa]